MLVELATVGGSDAALYFPNKPLIVVHQALYRLLRKGISVAHPAASQGRFHGVENS